MADFFNQEDNGKRLMYQQAGQPSSTTNRTIDNNGKALMYEQAAPAIERVEQRKENRERYQVDLPDELYEIVNQACAYSDNPEEEYHKWACAFKYSEMYGISLEDAITNVDNYNAALWPDKKETSYKHWLTAIIDAGVIGNNSWKIGELGNRIALAEQAGDTEKLALLLDELEAIEADNETRYDNVPRNWAVEALKTGAQSAPFTVYTGATALFGNFIAPGAGTALSFAESSMITKGQEYIEMRKKGYSPKIANTMANISGVIQGGIEVGLGMVSEAAYAGKVAKAAKVGAELPKDFIGKVSSEMVKRFHFGPGERIATDFLLRYGKNILEEGAEEGLQQIVSIVGQDLAKTLEELEQDDTFGDFLKSFKENYKEDYDNKLNEVFESIKGGIVGAIVLGAPVSLASTGLRLKDYADVRDAAQSIPSEQMFEAAVSDSKVFKDMDETSKKEAIKQVWEANQGARDEVWTNSAQDLTEVSKANEGYEEAVVDEETGEEIVEDVYRESNGDLYVNNKISEDGKTGSYRVGDPTKKSKNLYANIEYEINEDTNTVTITEFSLPPTREGLRTEVFENFAEDFVGKEIVWETKGNLATKIKENLIQNNPRGKNFGLSYYDNASLQDKNTRSFIIKNTMKAAPQVGSQGAAGLALYMESIAKNNGKSLTDFYKEVFGADENGNLNNMYGDIKVGEAIANTRGKSFYSEEKDIGARGLTVNRAAKELMREYNSIIYVGKNGDFGTLAHEVIHASRHHFSPEILAEAEALVGVEDHNWTEANDEQLAKYLEEYLVNEVPPVELEQHKNVLQKIADFFMNLFNALRNTGALDENEKLAENDQNKVFYDKLLKFTEQQRKDNLQAYRETVRANNNVQQQTETQTQTETQQEIKPETAEETEAKTQEASPYFNQVKDVLSQPYFSEEYVQNVTELLNDETISVEEKNRLIDQIRQTQSDLKNALFQVYHEDSIRRVSQNAALIDIVNNYNKAVEAYNVAKTTALAFDEDKVNKTIKYMTNGWEHTNAGWILETDDRITKVYSNKDYWGKKIESMDKLLWYLNKSPETLVKMSNDETNPLRLKDLFTDKVLNEVFPKAQDTVVHFIRDNKTGLFNVNEKHEFFINLSLLASEDKTPAGVNSLMAELTQFITSDMEGFDIKKSFMLANRLEDIVKIATSVDPKMELNGKIRNTLKMYTNTTYSDTHNRLARIVATRAMNNLDPRLSLFQEENTDLRTGIKDKLTEAIENLDREFYEALPNDLRFQTSEEKIRQQYYNTENWLKAPNGNKTNLTEKQWCQVRTPEFKQFFGDWENDPANASKIVDENGEPKVVYHDTNAKNYINQETGENWDDLDFLDKDAWRDRNDWDQFWKEQDFFVFNNKKARTSCEMPAYFFAPEMDPYHEYGSRTIQSFLNIRNPAINPEIENAGVTDWAGLEAMDKLIEAGYDGFIRIEDGKIYETNSFYPTQIKSATSNNGNWDSLNSDIRFQEVTEDMKARAYKYLSTWEDTKEVDRILNNLNHPEIGSTGWADLVINCLNVREDMQKLFKGEAIAEDSLFNESDTYREIVSNGPDAIYRYFDSKSNLIGGDGNTKALYSVAGSFVNCNPSPACAKYCYAVAGRSGMASMIINRELVNWCIENNPDKAAEIVARQYHRTGTIFENKLALRLLDTGDMSQQWVTFVNKLNNSPEQIACSIFSKRPEILEQIDPKKNVIQLSLDKTNKEVGKKYPNLPKAWVLGEAVIDEKGKVKSVEVTEEDRQFLDDNMQTYLDNGGVILPLVVKRGSKKTFVSRESLLSLPKWTRNYMCPLDAGWKELGNESVRETNTDTWNCSVCDKNGQGCSFIRAAKNRMKQFALLKDIPQGVINEIHKQEIEKLEASLRKLGTPEAQIRSIIDPMVAEWAQKLDDYVRGGEGSVSYGNSEGSTGQTTAGPGTGSDTRFQTAESRRIDEDNTYLKAVMAGDMTTAKAMVDAKIAEQVEIFARLQDDQDVEGFKYYRGKAPTKTINMYAVFNVSQDGFRAAYAGNKIPTPVGVWLSAQSLQSYVSDKLTFNDGSPKEYIRGDTGSSAGNYFSEAKLKEYGLTKSSKMLLKRAGKHGVMDVVNFSQMNLGVDENGKPVSNKKIDGALPHNKLVFEIECGIDDEGDLTEYVKTHGRMDGSRNEGLAEIQPNQFYAYKTNPNASGAWGLASTYRIKRLVPYEEVVESTNKANEAIRKQNEEIKKRNEGKAKKDQEKLIAEIALQKWVGGYKPEDAGLTVELVDQMYQEGMNKKLQDPVTYDDEGKVIPLSQRFNTQVQDIRFQTVYHGSAADFSKFNIEQYGYSGEGAMTFGYGSYFTDDEEIAIGYAEKLDPAKEAKNQYKALVQNVLGPINSGTSTKEAVDKGITWAEKVINDTNGFYTKDTKAAAEMFRSLLNEIDYETTDYEYILKLADDVLDRKKTRRLYSVDIPDNGYLKWDEAVTQEDLNRIAPYYIEVMEDAMKNGDFAEEWPTYSEEQKNVFRKNWKDEITGIIKRNGETLGAGLYYTLYHSMPRNIYPDVKMGKKAASKLLSKAGYVGIDYPAGTLSGVDSKARNYVIFNDEDAQIVDHLRFQTMEDLYGDARSFDNWQSFMESYIGDVEPEKLADPTYHSQVPSDADAQWYQSTWETAHNIKTEESLNQEEINDKLQKEGLEASAMDALFVADIRKNTAMLDDFLLRVAEIDAIDLNDEDWQQAEDQEDAAARDKIATLQDFIGTQLTHGNWVYNAQRVRAGKELTEGARNRIIGLIRSNPRSYRAIYSVIMEDDSYAVSEEDTMQSQLAGKLKRYKLVNPNEDIEKINPERMKKLADEVSNIEVASKLKNGSMKMGNELDNYLKSLRKQIQDQEKEYNELEKETYADYQRIADAEKRDLLKLHEKMLKARNLYKAKNDEISRLMAKGLKISGKYQKDAQNLRADYNEIFRKFKDLESVIRIDSQVQEALKRQEQVVEIKDNLMQKKQEANAVQELKRLRTQLVKRTMRRVPFDRIDYEDAKTIIAIQRVLEPNLLGGVNRWIGTESPILREVISGVITDVNYKEGLVKYLMKGKITKGKLDFIKLLNETKTLEQFNTWTKAQRKAALRYLPKEDWIKDLNLLQLAKEREESIDLDIDLVERERPMVDENGNQIINKTTGEPYMQTSWELDVSPEIEKMVQDVVGPDLYNNMVNRPFADWTTEELERLAVLINTLYKDGRDKLAAKKQEQKEIAAEIRNRIEKTVKHTGIVINDDDDDITKSRKLEKINKILGLEGTGLKGTEAGKDKGFKARVNRLLHSYNDANVRRVARILDNLGEGINTNELYWKENEAYTAKQSSINSRAEMIQQVMKENGITIEDLASTVVVGDREYTIDELLYFLAASKDVAYDENGNEDYYAATSKNAVMFGNMFSSKEDLEQKAAWIALNDDINARIAKGELTQEEKELQVLGQLSTEPGTKAYKQACIDRFEEVLAAANQLEDKYQKLLEAIQNDYAQQYERMNKVSIDEFNAPVHRVKAYVPLVRLESNGDTNANQVKEDLLATMGGQSKQWVNKGMTQRRTSQGPLHQKPVQTGLYKTWSNSVERTEHFIAYAPYVRELNRIYKSRDAEYTRRYIEARYGKGMISYIDDYINEVANPTANKVRNAGDELLRTLRGKTAPAYLAWKASAIIKQGATSPWPFMQFVNPAQYLAASWKCIASRGQMYDMIKEKSVFMKNRVMDPMNDLIDEMADQAKNKFDRAIGNFNKKGMAGLEWIDWVCVAPGWLACYETKYAELNGKNEEVYQAVKAKLQEENDQIDFNSPDHLSEEQIEARAREAQLQDVEKAAVDYADDCTRLCQPSNRSVDIAPLFKNSSEAMKAYLQFQTSLNVIWQNLRYDIPYNVRNNMGFRIAGTIIGYALAGIFMNSIMEGYSDDDKDKYKGLREAIYYATTQFTDAVPMIGSELTNTMDKLITGKQQFMNTGTDMTPTASKFFAILTNAKKGNWQKAAEMTAEGFAMSLGLPVSGAKEIKKLFSIGDGDGQAGLDLGNVYGIVDNITEDEDE